MLSNNVAVSCLWRIFFPVIFIVSIVLVSVSLTTRNLTPRELLESLSNKPEALNSQKESLGRVSRTTKMILKNGNFTEPPIPHSVEEKSKFVDIHLRRILLMDVNTFYREANPPSNVEPSRQTILLLHGANFKSETWVNLNTFHLLAAMGHRVIGVDLPGYGETGSSLQNGDKGKYLKDLIEALHMKNIVIVSPSMSGSFSIPFLLKHSKMIDGFIPVAPVSTNEIVYEAPNITTPTLIVYGELDRGLGFTSLNHLSRLPNSQAVVLPNAKHPAYLDQPLMFHTLIYNFMKHLKEQARK